VRIRVGHGEARVLDESSAEAQQLLALARELIREPAVAVDVGEDDRVA
jgi:hypothetical protein